MMYYPKQIPYRLDQEFQKNISYEEHHVQELEEYCMCIWEMKSKQILDKTIANNILPDACIDLVIDFARKAICFAGYSKETEPFALQEKIDYMGVRLKPGAFYSIFQVNADSVMDNMIPFSKIETEYNLDNILSVQSTEERIAILKRYLLHKIADKPSQKFIEITNDIYANPKEQKVEEIAKKLGYQKRQLFRIFKTNYGVSPKVLLNILRLHFCLTLLQEQKMELVEIAMQCGFYDQSHFMKEIKRYTGISPLKLF